MDSDVVIIGAGAAGLSLAWRLLSPPADVTAPTVVLIDAPRGSSLRPPERTWCYWEQGEGDYDSWLSASWRQVRVRAPDGRPLHRDLGGLRYKMLSSTAFARGLEPRLAEAHRIEAVVDHADGVSVAYRPADHTIRHITARWVFDSRPPTFRPLPESPCYSTSKAGSSVPTDPRSHRTRSSSWTSAPHSLSTASPSDTCCR